MDIEGKLQLAAQGLANAEGILRRAADAYPFLDGPGRAFRRMAQAANRPLRIGTLGEANSGKSSLANLLAGASVLPADPVLNTALPSLLKYASKPSVTVIFESGRRVAFPAGQNVAQVIANIQDEAVKGNLLAG
jgi:ribosome biogenesis GTPase A